MRLQDTLAASSSCGGAVAPCLNTRWFLPARQLLPPQPLVLTWQVPVSEVYALGQKAAAAAGSAHALWGPSQGPFMGSSWRLGLSCLTSNDNSGMALRLCSRVVDDVPQDVHMKWKFTGSVRDAAGRKLHVFSALLSPPNMSSVKPMGQGTKRTLLKVSAAGGCVDEAALAAAGWPTSGNLTVELTILEVV
jgi:hypothetical protein